MSNRHVEELYLVYEALVKDALCTYPHLESAFRKDLHRLKILSRKRGVRLFTVELPAIGKHLDKCLADGRFTLSGLPLTGRAKKGEVFPKYLGELLRLVFDEGGLLKEDDCDVEALVFLRQFLYCAKKTELPCSTENTLQEIEDFVSVDTSLPIPETVWSDERVSEADMMATYRGFTHDTSLMSRLVNAGLSKPDATLLVANLDRVAGLVTNTLGSYEPSEWDFRHGPGAIAEATGPVNKYHWRNWSPRLEERYPIADYGYHSYSSWASSLVGEVASQEAASRLVAVPKTFLKPRLIAAEPSENQWCQQNLWHYFSDRTQSSWLTRFIRFRDQVALNQELCRKASLDGSLVTVDLSAASDRVTCNVVGQVFRSNPKLLCHLQAVRTRFLTQDLHKGLDREIELRKFSTMGSACTFPVESLVFLVVTLASCFTARGIRVRDGNITLFDGEVAVFGDDIIAPKDSWELLQKALSALHFKVNESKSFVTGRFRESCGIDAFRGVDVTPVYWKGICNGKPDSVASTLAVSNNFFTKRFFIHTAKWIAKSLPCSFARVDVDSGVVGLKSFLGPDLSRLTRRENRDLQRTEALVWTISSTMKRLPTNDDSALLQYFTEKPEPTTQWSHGVTQKASVKLRKQWISLSELQAPPARGA